MSGAADLPAPTIAAAGSTAHSLDRSSHFRQVAQWGVQAADALEYAHQMGIIHRDIKPANLIIDERGQLWITDFGLAHKGDTNLTLPGDVLGTLRYMSPEQALARGPVDHRVDIYSLGATLYELLALQPGFSGGDRRELLRRIAFEEVAPLRRTRRDIPVELETIVLKALAKEPESRYATAQELADDLRRFLDDRPIQARRPSLAQRGRKWLRRHKAAVTAVAVTAVLLLTVAVFGLAITSLRIAQEQARTRDALARTEKQRGRAETNFQKVLDGVENLLLEVSRERWPEVPQLDKIRVKLLEDARVFYENFLDEAQADPARQPEAARLGACVAKLDQLLGRFADSESAQGLARRAFEKLLGDFPEEYRYASQLADLLLWAGQTGRAPAVAEANYRRAIALRRIPADYALVREEQAKLGKTYHDLGYLLTRQPQRAREAEEPYRQALEIQRPLAARGPARDGAKAALATTLNSLGLLLRTLGRAREAEALHREALTVCAELAREYPGGEGRYQEARAHNHLALSLWLLDQPSEALGHVRRSLALHRHGAAEAKIGGVHTRELIVTYRTLARMLEQSHEDEPAEEAYRQALELANQFVRECPEYEEGLSNQIMAHFSLAEFLAARQRIAEGKELVEQLWRQAPRLPGTRNHFAWLLVTIADVRLRDADRAVSLAQDAVREVPGDGMYWNTLGVAQYRAGAWSAAQEALAKSMQLRNGGDSYDWFVLAMTCHQGGEPARARRWFDQAVAWMDKNRPNDPDLRSFRAEAATRLMIEQ